MTLHIDIANPAAIEVVDQTTAAPPIHVDFNYGSNIYNVTNNITTSGPAGLEGAVYIDDFPTTPVPTGGTAHDAQLKNAHDYMAAQTYKRAILYKADAEYTHTAQLNVNYNGFRLLGPTWATPDEDITSKPFPMRVTLNLPGGTAWMNFPDDRRSCEVGHISFYSTNSTTQAFSSGATTGLKYTRFHDLAFKQLQYVWGTASTKMLFTGVTIDGFVNINNILGNTAFRIGGSDNFLFMGTTLWDASFAGQTGYHMILDYMSKSVIGPIYMTCRGKSGILVLGNGITSTSPEGDVQLLPGFRIEGNRRYEQSVPNVNIPCYGALIRVEGGGFSMAHGWVGWGMADSAQGSNPGDRGSIHQTGGHLTVGDGVIHGLAQDPTQVALPESDPFIYSTGALSRLTVGDIKPWGYPSDGVTLAASATAGATTLTVAATPRALPSGAYLRFNSGAECTLTAAAAAGATSLSVTALTANASSGSSSIARPLVRAENNAAVTVNGFTTETGLPSYIRPSARISVQDPTAPIRNNAESGFASGTVVTAGKSYWPDAFSAITSGANTFTYNSSAAYKGSLGYKVDASIAIAQYATWPLPAPSDKVVARFYMKIPTLPTGGDAYEIFRFFDNTTNFNRYAAVGLNASGQLFITNNQGTTANPRSGAGTIAANIWNRIEVSVQTGITGTGQVVLGWCTGTGAAGSAEGALTSSITYPASLTGSTAGGLSTFGPNGSTVGVVRFGKATAGTNLWTGWYLDDLAVDTDTLTFLGPS